MIVIDKGKLTDMDLDRRVRERLLASGELDPVTIESYLARLPDMEEHSELLPFDQPALGAGSHVSRAEAAHDDEGSE